MDALRKVFDLFCKLCLALFVLIIVAFVVTMIGAALYDAFTRNPRSAIAGCAALAFMLCAVRGIWIIKI